jgi:hypothetical protein
MKLRYLLSASFLFIATPATAETLSGDQIKQTVVGKRILLATRFGVEFPLVYRSNGSVKGDGTGTGLGRYFSPKETGKWWIKNSQLCQKFPTWYDGRTQCFTLKKIGNNKLRWKTNDGRSGTARVS